MTVVAPSHDPVRERSIVGPVRAHDPEKSVALPVPFGRTLEAVGDEAERASRRLSAETAAPVVKA